MGGGDGGGAVGGGAAGGVRLYLFLPLQRAPSLSLVLVLPSPAPGVLHHGGYLQSVGEITQEGMLRYPGPPQPICLPFRP